MAVTFFGAGAIADSTGADITLPLPVGWAENDILIALVLIRDVDDTVTWPSGWAEGWSTDRGTISRAKVAWKRATASESDILVDKSTATGDTYGVMVAFRGCIQSGSPFDGAGSTNTGTAQNGTTTGISTSDAGHHIVVMLTEEDNVVASLTVTATDPASIPSRAYVQSTRGADATLTVHSADRATAGATGTINHNWDAVPDGWHSFVFALKPVVSTEDLATKLILPEFSQGMIMISGG